MTHQKKHRRYECPLVFPRVFGRRQCERIIETGLTLPRESGAVSAGDEEEQNNSIRQAEIAWLPLEPQHHWVYDKLRSVFERANRTFEFELAGFTEEAQFTCYHQTGAFYHWHQDGLEGELAGRKLSLVVQLSEPTSYNGSDLELFSLSSDEGVAESWRDDLRAQGSVIAFPAFEYHRVTSLNHGQRYSLVCWVGGPPFR